MFVNLDRSGIFRYCVTQRREAPVRWGVSEWRSEFLAATFLCGNTKINYRDARHRGN